MKRYHQVIAGIIVMVVLCWAILAYTKILQDKWLSPIWSKCDTWRNFKVVQEWNQYIRMCNSWELYKIRTYIYKK